MSKPLAAEFGSYGSVYFRDSTGIVKRRNKIENYKRYRRNALGWNEQDLNMKPNIIGTSPVTNAFWHYEIHSSPSYSETIKKIINQNKPKEEKMSECNKTKPPLDVTQDLLAVCKQFYDTQNENRKEFEQGVKWRMDALKCIVNDYDQWQKTRQEWINKRSTVHNYLTSLGNSYQDGIKIIEAAENASKSDSDDNSNE